MNKNTLPAAISILSMALSVIILYLYRPSKPAPPPLNIIKQHENKDRINSVPIVLYHSINGLGIFSVTHETLEKHFSLYKRMGLTVLSLDNLEKQLQSGAPIGKKTIIITFDDGYKSMYTHLYPLAKKYNYPITLFIYTDFISSSGSSSLTWTHLRSLEKGNISIECHSMSHPDMTQIITSKTKQSRYRLYRELYLSKRMIELYLQKKVKYFAFPYGRYTIELIELARMAGYSRVFSTDYGTNILSRNNFCIKRHHIKNTFNNEYIKNIVQ